MSYSEHRKFTPQEVEEAFEMERSLITGEYPAGDVPVSFPLDRTDLTQDDLNHEVITGEGVGATIDNFHAKGLAVGSILNKFTGGELFVARTREAIIDPLIDSAKDATEFIKDHKKIAIGTGIAASAIAAAVGALVLYNRRKK